MKRRLLNLAAAVSLGMILAVAALWVRSYWRSGSGFHGPRVQRPQSDVPVIANVGSWPYQKDLRIDDLAVTVVDAPLNLFNNQALVRFRVQGRVAERNGWRPFIKEVQLSQRLATSATTKAYGDFQLVPVVGVKHDEKYAGEDVQFDVKVEQLIESLDWGSNRYVVVAGDKQTEFTLRQVK